jgi:ArsR family transcriptional regulator
MQTKKNNSIFNKPYYEARAKVFKALGHPTRLLFADHLARGEKCVCELQVLVHADMSTVSKHLTVMREAGIVSMEKRGSNVYYALKMECLAGFLACLDQVLGTQA